MYIKKMQEYFKILFTYYNSKLYFTSKLKLNKIEPQDDVPPK